MEIGETEGLHGDAEQKISTTIFLEKHFFSFYFPLCMLPTLSILSNTFPVHFLSKILPHVG